MSTASDSGSPGFTGLRERLARAHRALTSIDDDVDRERRILHERAVQLAREISVETMPDVALETVDFLLAGEMFGVEVAHVREILPLRDVTRLPCTPTFVIGVINLRGKILSVIDVRKFYALPDSGITDLNKVIILGDQEMEFGILADRILGVRQTPLHEIQAGLPTLHGVRQDSLKGITNQRVAILDAQKLLRDQRILVNEKV